MNPKNMSDPIKVLSASVALKNKIKSEKVKNV